MRLLLAEDEKDLNQILQERLRKEGYTVDSCMDGRTALEYLQTISYDCAVMDILMPEMTGLDVVHEIRKQGNRTPILLLTALDSVQDRVTGLDAGAEDYLVKPFAMEELLARLRTIIRMSAGNPTNSYRVEDLTMDVRTRRVVRAGREIALSAREFAVLEYLMRNQGIVLTRELIEEHILDFAYEGGSNLVDVYIRYLRRKIDEGFDRKLIHTVRGVGYVLRGEE